MVCYNRQFNRPKCHNPNSDHTGGCLNLEGWAESGTPILNLRDVVDTSRSVKIFWAEVRRHHAPPYMNFVYVSHSGSGSFENAVRYDRGDSNRRYYLANNATQVREYITRHPESEFVGTMYIDTQYGPKRRADEETKLRSGGRFQTAAELVKELNMPTPSTALTKAEKLRLRAERLIEEAEKIESRPLEPAADDDGCATIWWKMRFNDGHTLYTYAATRAGDGLWYTTGPSSPKGYPWEDLINWIYERSSSDPQIWFATEWDTLV